MKAFEDDNLQNLYLIGLKTLLEMEEMLTTSIFSISHYVFEKQSLTRRFKWCNIPQ